MSVIENKLTNLSGEVTVAAITPSYSVSIEDIAAASDEMVNQDMEKQNSIGLLYLRELAREIVKLKGKE